MKGLTLQCIFGSSNKAFHSELWRVFSGTQCTVILALEIQVLALTIKRTVSIYYRVLIKGFRILAN